MSSSLPYLLHSKHRSLELCSLLLSHRFVIFVTAENWCLLVLRKSLEHDESINQCTGAKCHFLSPGIDTKDASVKPLACASAWHEGFPLASLVFKLFKGPYALRWGVEPASRRNFPSDGLAYLFHFFWAARTARPILMVTTSCALTPASNPVSSTFRRQWDSFFLNPQEDPSELGLLPDSTTTPFLANAPLRKPLVRAVLTILD